MTPIKTKQLRTKEFGKNSSVPIPLSLQSLAAELHDLRAELRALRRDTEFRFTLLLRQIERPPVPAPWQGTAASLQQLICAHFAIAPRILTCQRRTNHLVRARQLFCLLLREQLDLDNARISKIVRRDRSQIPRDIKRARHKIATVPAWRSDYETLMGDGRQKMEDGSPETLGTVTLAQIGERTIKESGNALAKVWAFKQFPSTLNSQPSTDK